MRRICIKASNKMVRWAGIDVFGHEDGCQAFWICQMSMLLHSIGANTLNHEEIAKQAAQAAMKAARGIVCPNALNLPTSTTKLPELPSHYMELTQKLGFLCSQLR